MGLTSALNSAMSGLAAASRASQIVSDNIANAMTPGYATRSLELSSDAIIGSGVRVVGIDRETDPALTASRRAADAELVSAETEVAFLGSVELLVGSALDDDSISARLAAFETSLIAAASAPESDVRLNDVARKATEFAQSIADAANGIQDARASADKSAATQVETLNDRLEQVKQINVRITAIQSADQSAAALYDQRDVLIDEINQIVPVNVVDRANGQIALYSDGGAILLDGSTAEIEFTPATLVAPHSSIEDGSLSVLSLNGIDIKTEALGGGSLAAQLEIRDQLGPELQAQLDSLAVDMIERFEASGLDSSVSVGDPGLFTDAGNALDPNATLGLANRLSVNQLVSLEAEAETWRLRDGLGATERGQVGDASLLTAFSLALTTPHTVEGLDVTAADLASNLVSGVAARVVATDSKLSFAATSQAELERFEAELGVDTDAELQTLMIVERAYAANARIVQAVEEMMDSLMRI